MTATFTATLWGLAMLSAPAESPDGKAFSLSWDATAPCPDQSAVEDAISRSLVSSAPGASPVHASATVSKRGDSYHLDLELSQGVDSGHREIESQSCTELADLTAWFVAVAVDPRLSARPHVHVPAAIRAARERAAVPDDAPPEARSGEASPSIPAPPSPSTAAATPESSAPGGSTSVTPASRPPRATSTPASQGPPRRVDPESNRKLRGLFAAGAGIEANVLPGVGAAFSLIAGFDWRLMRWEFAGWYALPRERRSPENDRVGGTFQGGAAALRGCGVPRAGPVLFPLCLAIEVGGIWGEGSGDLEPARAAALWAGLGPLAGVVWRFRPWVGLRLDAQAVFSLARPTFSTTPSGAVFKPGAIGARATAGIEFVLP
jgi:hypothetical protein